MQAIATINLARDTLRDPDAEVWSDADLAEFLRDGLRALTVLRPESNTETLVMSLVAGSIQELPPEAVRLRSVLANCDDQGSPGRSVRVTERRVLDQFKPSWRTQPQQPVVREYFQDTETPRDLHVYPPADGTGHLLIRASVVPELGDIESDPALPVQEIYSPALVDWICYRAFIRSDENTPDHTRGLAHYQRFMQLLQVDAEISVDVSPRSKEQLK